MSNFSPPNLIRKKDTEITSRQIFDIKLKSNDFNNIILNELNGFKSIFYLKNKKLHQFFFLTKKKQEYDILKNYEIIYLDTNLNHTSLICLSSNGCIFSINYDTNKVIYFSNLDFNKFIIPNVIINKKRNFFGKKTTKEKNNFDNLNHIYNIFCNNSSDKLVLNLNKFILFWYKNNYSSNNNLEYNNIIPNNKIEPVSGTIYSIIKDNEIEKISLNKNDVNINNLNEGVCVTFVNNFFLGSHTRIFYVLLVNGNNNNKVLYIFDYLFKFNYENRFRCVPNTPKNDFIYSDLFNTTENEDLNDIKSKISSTVINFNIDINLINNKNLNLKRNNENINANNSKNNQIILKPNTKGNVLAIIISDDVNYTNIINYNTTLIFFMTETYVFYRKKIINIITKKLIENQDSIFISNIDWICNDMFLLILTSKGYFFLLDINFQLINITEINSAIINYDKFYIPFYIEKMYNNNMNKKNNNIYNEFKLLVSKQREDLFMINNKDYIVCYQMNYKNYENKIINKEISPDNFNNFLFLIKYFQLYLPYTQIENFSKQEITFSIMDIMKKYFKNLFSTKKNNNAFIANPEAEIIQTETGIKIMKTIQNEEDNNINNEQKNDMEYYKNKKYNFENNSFTTIIKFINIFRSMELLHEKNLYLINFIGNKTIDFLIYLINHKELWLAMIFIELCEKYLCNQLYIFKTLSKQNENNLFNYQSNKKVPLSQFIFKSNNDIIINSNIYIPYFFDFFKNFGVSPYPSHTSQYHRFRLLLIFCCLIEFRTTQTQHINILFFVMAKFLVEKLKEKEGIEELYKVTKIIVKNYKYLKQENDKIGKDEFVLSSLALSYRNQLFSDLNITETERDDLSFDFFAEFYHIDDFIAYTEPSENFCKNDDLNLLSEFNYLNNTGILQKLVIYMTNYLYFEFFEEIKKFMDYHLRQVKNKTENNISPEEKSLSKLVFFNMVFILQYLLIFLKDIINFLTQKESNFNDNNKENINFNENNENYMHYSDKIQDDFNKILFKSISPIDIPFIIFTFYIYVTNPENKSKAYDINKELGKRIMSLSRICALSMDDLLELIEFIHLNGFNYIDNNINNEINNNMMISQLDPKDRIQNSIFTSFCFYFFIIHKLNLIYLLESELDLIYSVFDALNINQRKQLYELIFIITNGTLKHLLKMQFNQKLSSVETKYMEILLAFDKIMFYKMIKEESCFVRKNISDFVKISPTIMSSYLLEGALYYEYKNFNKLCKKIITLDKIIVNNIHLNNNIKNKKIANNVSIFEILYGLSAVNNNNNVNLNNINYGKEKKLYKQILKILFNNEKNLTKQFLIILNNIVKLLQIKHVSNNNNYTNKNLIIFDLENDAKYIKEIINNNISLSSGNKNTQNNEEEISNNILSTINLIIKGNFDNKNIFRFNNNEIKNKLVRNLKLIISKLLHALFEIQIKINLILYENKGTAQSKITYLFLLSQALLCEKNPKILKKIINDMLLFIKLLNIKKIISSSIINLSEIKSRLIDIIRNIEIAITLNFGSEYELKKISEFLQILGTKLTKIINYQELDNLTKILPQITSKKLQNFLIFLGIPTSSYHSKISEIYQDLLYFSKFRGNDSEKFLIKARKQYIKLSDAFYNMLGIPQKSFIEFNVNWDLVERERLYQAIIVDDLDDNLYNNNYEAKNIMNQRQKTGKETPRKIRKNSVSNFIKNNKRKKNKINSSINNDINNKEKNIINKNNKILKIKKEKEYNINSTNDMKKIIFLKKTVRKMIYNRFIHNIFLFLDKGKENTFKIYSISDKDKTEKNVEVIKLNPIFIV